MRTRVRGVLAGAGPVRASWSFVLLASVLVGAPSPATAEDLRYELPAAGSYALPAIDWVGDYEMLGADGRRGPLLDLAAGQCAVVSFVYLSCTDARGCPLALATLRRLDRLLADRDDLADRVRLVTVSFDPERDRPPQLARLRKHMDPRADWRFVTAASPAELRPVLRDYGQDAVPLLTANGAFLGRMRHVAKVFLIDAEGAVRNVYSSGLMDHRLLLRDLETLLLTDAAATRP